MKIEKSLLNSTAGDQWKIIGVKNHHGINLPLFSLRSQNSCGIGEYPDLIPLFGWCRGVGLSVIQLLPLNDNGPDTSPYSSISAFALNPMHLSIVSLPEVEKTPGYQSCVKGLQALNELPRVDYAEVREAKKKFFRAYYNQHRESILTSPGYQTFLDENAWLNVFALFKTLKIHRKWTRWQDWDAEVRDITDVTFDALSKKFKDELDYHKVIQFLCFEQFQAVKNAAAKEAILIKGDIPILLNRESADVWYHRHLFDLEYDAGAPPDVYSDVGQNWGFPLYNWVEMQNEDYTWWKKRLEVASKIYDIYRIDHVVGFFRIWAVPDGALAKNGFFIPRDFNEWTVQGETLMRLMLETTKMLPIGEDLGVVPPEVRACLTYLGIPGTRVMRWQRYWNSPNHPFIHTKDYPTVSMTTVSTHDSDTLQLWWQNFPDEARAFCTFKGWSYAPELSKPHQKEILYDSHHSASLFHINLLQEYFPLVPELRGDDPEAERVNIPGVVSSNNWSYRFRPCVEEIIAHDPLKQTILDLIL